MIAEVGYHKASFARIAKRVRISPGLITYHFAAKDDLIDAVMADVTQSMEAELAERLRGVDSYREALRRIIGGQVRYFADHWEQTLVYGAIRAEARDDSGVLRYAGEREGSVQQLRDFLAKGQDAGEFRRFDPRWMAVSLLAALEAVPGELRARPGTDIAACAEELAEAFDLATRA